MPGDERDSKGRYIKKTLTTAQARTMQAKKHEKSVGEKNADYETLIREAGYADPEDAPKVLQIVVKDIVARGNRTMAAVIQYRQLTGKTDSTSKPGKPAPGSVCPLCHEMVFTDFRPTDSQMQEAEAILDLDRGNGDSPIV